MIFLNGVVIAVPFFIAKIFFGDTTHFVSAKFFVFLEGMVSFHYFTGNFIYRKIIVTVHVEEVNFMSNIIKVRALEDFKGMQPEEWPFHVWLPYKQINSERFISEDTKEIWHRFDSVSIFDEDDPDDDLIEETEEFPDNIVSWLGKSGTIPAVGDTFQVLDHDNNVLFEETIHGTEALFGAKYAIAEKKADSPKHLFPRWKEM